MSNNPFQSLLFVLTTDPAIDWEGIDISREDYQNSKETWRLKFKQGLKPYKFHIRRLSYSELQTAKEFTDTFEAKLFILEKSLMKIEDLNGEIFTSNLAETLRDLLNLEDFHEVCDVCFNSQSLSMQEVMWLKMSAWNNTPELDEALQVPCGCSLIHRAEEEVDRTAADLLREEAPEFQKQWGCKAVCLKGEKPTDKALESIIPLSNLTKVNREALEKNLDTCPKYLLSRPWISEAVQFYNWFSKSQLNVLFTEPKQFKNTIKEAVDSISQGIGIYNQYQTKQLELKIKNQNNEDVTKTI